MKISEIDWTEGLKYQTTCYGHEPMLWTLKNGELVNLDNFKISSEFSIKKLINDVEFRLMVDWTNVPVDAKILVSQDGKNWEKRHFAKYERGRVFAYLSGHSSWTTNNAEKSDWNYAKLTD